MVDILEGLNPAQKEAVTWVGGLSSSLLGRAWRLFREMCYDYSQRGQNMEYTVIIRKAPDGFYIASCPLLPEAHAQGETYEECLANIKEALELCLEYRRELGEEIPQEIGTKQVTITV